jgi:RNA polymerase sigma-70 factor (ECF subfamily)
MPTQGAQATAADGRERVGSAGQAEPNTATGRVDDAASLETFDVAAMACLSHVARFALSLTRAQAEADDLVQETYLRAFRSRHTFQQNGDMQRWLFTICKHAFLRQRERSAREPLALADDPTDDTREAVVFHNRLVASGDVALLDRVDLAPAIARALGRLSASLRTAVVLVDVEGYGYSEAAEIMQVPIGTVRSRLFRARRVLQELLWEYAKDAGLTITSTAERAHD